jgi:WD40 repeat protein
MWTWQGPGYGQYHLRKTLQLPECNDSISIYSHPPPIYCLALAPNRFVVGTADGSLGIWSTVTGDCLVWLHNEFSEGVSQIKISQKIFEGKPSMLMIASGFDGRIRVYVLQNMQDKTVKSSKAKGKSLKKDAIENKIREETTDSKPQPETNKENVLQMKQSRRLCKEKRRLKVPPNIRLIPQQRLQVVLLKTFQAHNRPIFDLEILPSTSGKVTRFVSASSDHKMILWDLTEPSNGDAKWSTEKHLEFIGHQDTVTCIAAYHDLLVSGSIDRSIRGKLSTE